MDEIKPILFMVFAVIGGAMLLLLVLEKIEIFLRNCLPKASPFLLSNWVQLNSLAVLGFLAGCVANLASSGSPKGMEFLVVPLVIGACVYAAPLAFVIVIALYDPAASYALVRKAYQSIRSRLAIRQGSNKA